MIIIEYPVTAVRMKGIRMHNTIVNAMNWMIKLVNQIGIK